MVDERAAAVEVCAGDFSKLVKAKSVTNFVISALNILRELHFIDI